MRFSKVAGSAPLEASSEGCKVLFFFFLPLLDPFSILSAPCLLRSVDHFQDSMIIEMVLIVGIKSGHRT